MGDTMNVKRGLFRLWILASVAWSVLIISDNWSGIKDPYIQEKRYVYRPTTQVIELLSDDEQSKNSRALLMEHDQLPLNNRVTLYIPQGVDVEAAKPLVQEFARTAPTWRQSDIEEARKARIYATTKSVTLPIFFSFIVGAALMWAIAGFARPHTN